MMSNEQVSPVDTCKTNATFQSFGGAGVAFQIIILPCTHHPCRSPLSPATALHRNVLFKSQPIAEAQEQRLSLVTSAHCDSVVGPLLQWSVACAPLQFKIPLQEGTMPDHFHELSCSNLCCYNSGGWPLLVFSHSPRYPDPQPVPLSASKNEECVFVSLSVEHDPNQSSMQLTKSNELYKPKTDTQGDLWHAVPNPRPLFKGPGRNFQWGSGAPHLSRSPAWLARFLVTLRTPNMARVGFPLVSFLVVSL